jgi:hypothetical protein
MQKTRCTIAGSYKTLKAFGSAPSNEKEMRYGALQEPNVGSTPQS